MGESPSSLAIKMLLSLSDPTEYDLEYYSY